MRTVLLVGTRRVVERATGDYRVICATCDKGGTVPHRTSKAAGHAAIRDSNKPCPARPGCGAR